MGSKNQDVAFLANLSIGLFGNLNGLGFEAGFALFIGLVRIDFAS